MFGRRCLACRVPVPFVVPPLLLILFLFCCCCCHLVQPMPQRRPVRITPFLYSDALNIAGGGPELRKGRAMGVPQKFGWDSQAATMRQITPFLYSSVKRSDLNELTD